MIPILLEISAFGSFSNKTLIDFSLFKESLFLITGKTGSGKTTIFDAISFALYGEASGGNDKRTAKSFRSDYASLNTPTYVYLKFSHQNKIYEITRNPEYMRQSKRGGGKTKAIAKAELKYDNSTKVISKVEDVNNKVLNILGLSRDQFAQTSMVAQGDFLKILRATSDERKKLFQKIFHTTIYQSLQDLLKEHASSEEIALKGFTRDFYSTMNLIVISPSSKFYTELSDNTTNMSKEYLDVLSSYGKEQFDLLNDLLRQKNKIEEEKNIANTNYIDGLNTNTLYDKFDDAESKYNKLLKSEQQNDIDILNLGLSNQALDLKVIYDNYGEQVKAYDLVNKDYDEAMMNYKNISKELPISKDKYLKLKEKYEDIPNMNSEVSKLKDALSLLDDIKYFEKDKQQLCEDVKVALAKLEECKNNINNQEMLKDLAAAGILAKDLLPNMPCPVCGSLNHPKLASIDNSEYSEDTLKELKKSLPKLQSAFNDLSTKFKVNESNLITAKNDFSLLNMDKSIDKSSIEKLIKEKNNEIILIKKSFEESSKIYHDLCNDMSSITGKLETLKSSKNTEFDKKTKKEQAYFNALEKTNFKDFEGWNNYLLTPLDKKRLEDKINKFSSDKTSLASSKETLLSQLQGKQRVHIEELQQMKEKTEKAYSDLNNKYQSKLLDTNNLDKNIQQLKTIYKNYLSTKQKFVLYKGLSDLTNGQLSSQEKLSFESYIQRFYFDKVVESANSILHNLTNDGFELRLKKDSDNFRSQTGLLLDVLDRLTGEWRDVSTLSGGESFMASLALALGLSEIVQAGSGIVRIESMFIDEGFGTLDEESLNQAMGMLINLSKNHGRVGIISHVEELKMQIHQKIIVTKNMKGSTVEIQP